MKKFAWLFFVGTTLAGMYTVVSADPDIKQGEKLLNDKCFKCHDTSIYTRPNRIVHSYPALLKRVRFCESQLGLTWFDDEIDSVAAYLNTNFYKFETTKK